MGFWTTNSFVPTWSGFLSKYIWNLPPQVLESLSIRRQVELPQELIMRTARLEDLGAITEFWSRYFSNWSSCHCSVPLAHIKKMFSSGIWEIILVVRKDGNIVGTIVRRRIKNLHIREAKWSTAAVIDYFCVHPAWRKKGVGRSLLNAIHNTATVPMNPMPPQLIFWEGLKFLPPLSIGLFWTRRGVIGPGVQVYGEECEKAWNNNRGDIWTEKAGEEITFWKTEHHGIVIIWNTFHRSVPDGGDIGIVLGGSIDAVNSLALSSPWSVFLFPGYNYGTFESPWKMDSPFQWIGYNLSVGFVGAFPRIGF